jgi:hypothetical protein
MSAGRTRYAAAPTSGGGSRLLYTKVHCACHPFTKRVSDEHGMFAKGVQGIVIVYAMNETVIIIQTKCSALYSRTSTCRCGRTRRYGPSAHSSQNTRAAMGERCPWRCRAPAYIMEF